MSSAQSLRSTTFHELQNTYQQPTFLQEQIQQLSISLQLVSESSPFHHKDSCQSSPVAASFQKFPKRSRVLCLGAGYNHHWLLSHPLCLKMLWPRGAQRRGVLAHLPRSTSQCSPDKRAHADSSVCLVVKTTPRWSERETGSVQITAHRAHPTDLQIVTPSSSTTRRRGRDPFVKHTVISSFFRITDIPVTF